MQRLQNEDFTAYKQRRAASKYHPNTVREPVVNRWGQQVFAYSLMAPAKNGGHTGAGMANIRKARKLRAVRRHKAR